MEENDLHQALKDLRTEYVSTLRQKAEKIHSLLKACSGPIIVENDLNELLREVHSLTGSGATYGFRELSVKAFQVEEHIHEAVKTKSHEIFHAPAFKQALHLLGCEIIDAEQSEQPVAATEPVSNQIQMSRESAKSEGNIPLQALAAKLAAIDTRRMDFKSALEIGECRRLCEEILEVRIIEPTRHQIEQQATVLVVDDDQDIQRILKFYLENHGYNIICETVPSEGILQLERMVPDILLLDLMMPEMTGFEFLRKIQNRYDTDRTRIIVGSSRNYDNDRLAVLKAGAHDFIAKPYNLQELEARFSSCLEDLHGFRSRAS